jgi:hypothetical protein
MDYIPGNIHESLQKEVALKLNSDFNIPICSGRFHDTDMVEGPSGSLTLIAGDVVIVKWFKCGDSIPYTYIEKIIYSDSDELNVNAESTMSKSFVEINKNTYRDKLFTDVTLSYNRDNKINQIIN